MNRLIPIGLVLALLGSVVVPAQQTTHLNIVTFNMLAPAFARPASYPRGTGPLLDTAVRGVVLRNTVASLAADAFQDGRFLQADVIALQEVQPATLAALFLAGGLVDTEWFLFNVAHREDYWSSSYVTDPAEIAEAPWTANYFGHGNALLIRRSSFDMPPGFPFTATINTDSGNRAPVFVGSIGGRPVRISSVQLDSDVAGRRRAELISHLEQLPAVAGTVDIVAGDFSTDTGTGNTQGVLRREGFVDVLAALGGEDSTLPYSTGYYSSRNRAIADHVVVRGATPIEGRIHDFGLFQRFPKKAAGGQRDDNEDARVQAALSQIGADHFPVAVRVGF
jgi:endonuclease/exonuclease/phosphatase family metal-dependent hydrolase